MNYKVQKKYDYSAYLYLLPAGLIIITFHVLPVFYSFFLSFFEWNMIDPQKTFVGVSNYIGVLKDPEFRKAIYHTIFYVIGTVPANVIFPLLIALLLNTKIKGLSGYRTIYFIPVITSINAVSIVWKWIYNSQDIGLFNYLLSFVGITPINWLLDARGLFHIFFYPLVPSGLVEFGCANFHPEILYILKGPSVAMVSIIIMSIWKGLGYNVVIYLAGLQNIPQVLYEAAEIDGANIWQKFRNITVPVLSPIIFFILIMSIISSFQVFAQVYMMTGGGPLKSTTVVVYYLFENAFDKFRMGYALVIAYILFIIIFVLTIIQKTYGEKNVHYN